jgi:hypothetical protein
VESGEWKISDFRISDFRIFCGEKSVQGKDDNSKQEHKNEYAGHANGHNF